MLPLAPSGSEVIFNATSQLEGVGCPLGVAVTVAGEGAELIIFYICTAILNVGRGSIATEDIFAYRQKRLFIMRQGRGSEATEAVLRL